MTFFSVIIPLYNKEKYIEHAIKSILCQTHENFELIVVNDYSTDNSVKIVEQFHDDRITIIHHEKNKGLAAARNTGIKKAQSQYITFLDADDLWKPNFLLTIHHLIKTYKEASIFATNYEEIWQQTIRKPINGSETLEEKFEGYINFFEINLKQGIYCHGSVCFHKEVYEKVGLYNEKINFSEDIDFNIRANYHFKLAYYNICVMQYFMQTENQLTRTSIKNKSIPNFDLYEEWTNKNSHLKKYLDFERYVLGKNLKKWGDERWRNIIKSIDSNNLNFKQRMLLELPKIALLLIDKIKISLLKLNIKISSYN